MKKIILSILCILLSVSFIKASELDNVTISKCNNNCLNIKWNSEENQTYSILRSTSKNGKYKVIASVSGNSYNNKGLTYGKTYYYKIKTNNNTSKIVSKKVLPDKVNTIDYLVAEKSIKLSWNKIKVKGYTIYRSTDKKKWTKIATTSKTSYTNKKLKTNKTYYYKIKSYVIVKGKKIYSGYSNIIETKTIKDKYVKALNDANKYLKTFNYSKDELLSKLNYDNDSKKYVLNNIKIDFNENAVKNLEKYMSLFHFSKDEIIKELKSYDKFTDEEIDYAILKYNGDYGEESSSLEKKYIKDLTSLGYNDKEANNIIQLFKIDDINNYLFDRKYNNLLDFKSSDYFDIKKLNRYQEYYNKNKYDAKEVVLYVEIGIDYDFYTHMKPSNVKDGKLILVNKYNYINKNYKANLEKLGSGYGNGSLNKEAAKNFRLMVNAAKKDGIKLKSVSAYRSYSTQKSLYNSYAKRDGKKKADTYSARAGHSEHNTGLAVDINTASSKAHFENTKAYKWLINNSYKYGFALRYLKGKEFITGYKYEPWHYRYFGVDVATKLHDMNITYEEYLVISRKK